jgi:hypothetical protein
MTDNYRLYLKYKHKYSSLKNQIGGYKINSSVGRFILTLSQIKGQTADIKRTINNKITNTGHGSIFLGSSSSMRGGDKNIRILVGAHFHRYELKIGLFGGKCNKDEKTIHTMIRETIEEIFNFKPSIEIIVAIEDFLNIHTDFYYIYKMGKSDSHSYLFDISILGNFIEIINSINNGLELIFPYPSGNKYPIIKYLSDDNFSDISSIHGAIDGKNTHKTINLIPFLTERHIEKRIYIDSLNEIKYLGFPSIEKIFSSIHIGSYNLYNHKQHRRDTIKFDRLFIKILTILLISDIKSYF